MIHFRVKDVGAFLSKLLLIPTLSFTSPDDDTDFMNNSKIVTILFVVWYCLIVSGVIHTGLLVGLLFRAAW